MTTPPVWGVDVSAIQGSVPFDALARGGAAYAFLRCKVGNDQGRDKMFAANVALARACGIFPGAYQFAYPLPHLDPAEQVRAFLDAAQVDGHVLGTFKGELPMALDLEWPPPDGLKKPDGTVGKGWKEWGCEASQILAWGLAALAEMSKQMEQPPVIYTYPHFLKRVLVGASAADLAELGSYPLWIAGGAGYQNGDGHTPDLEKEHPPIVEPWGGRWLFWQYDGNGGRRMPNGADADFNLFNGDLAALRELVGFEPPSDGSETFIHVVDAIAEANHHMVEDSIREYRLAREMGA